MSDKDDLPPDLEVKEEKPEVVEKKTATAKKSGNELSGKKVTIIIDEPHNAPSTQQFFGHNGRGFLITFGKPVKVPVELLNVLEECIETRTIPLEEGGFIERDHIRFSYRVVNKE